MAEILGKINLEHLSSLVIPSRLTNLIDRGWRRGELNSLVLTFFELAPHSPRRQDQGALDYELFINSFYIDDPDNNGPVFPQFQSLSRRQWQDAIAVPAILTAALLLQAATPLLVEEVMIGVLTICDQNDGAKLRLFINRNSVPYVHMEAVDDSGIAYLLLRNDEVGDLLALGSMDRGQVCENTKDL
ncbi:hypothetical protein [Acrocarpospora catenulata]|uniref:hypothetical protein n=1 Tax=Acrocarpospora catenulata TaxID=2836182 RepID=UPI001BDA7B4C|nr:hypothetical protein [Acrocarpospora catenulata]